MDSGVKSDKKLLEEKRRAELSARIGSGEFTVEQSGYALEFTMLLFLAILIVNVVVTLCLLIILPFCVKELCGYTLVWPWIRLTRPSIYVFAYCGESFDFIWISESFGLISLMNSNFHLGMHLNINHDKKIHVHVGYKFISLIFFFPLSFGIVIYLFFVFCFGFKFSIWSKEEFVEVGGS